MVKQQGDFQIEFTKHQWTLVIPTIDDLQNSLCWIVATMNFAVFNNVKMNFASHL